MTSAVAARIHAVAPVSKVIFCSPLPHVICMQGIL
jgi:hypothetical protein